MPSNAAEQMLQYLRQAATELPVVLTDEQLAAFAVYYDFLLEYNEKVNLTRITEPLDVAVPAGHRLAGRLFRRQRINCVKFPQMLQLFVSVLRRPTR